MIFTIFTILTRVQSRQNRVVGVIMEPGSGDYSGMHVVPTSIIKIVQMNGMEAVPILLNQSTTASFDLVQKCNAVIFSFQRDDFDRAQQFNLDKLILLVQALNKNGTDIPVLALGNGLNKLFSIFLPQTSTVLGQIDRIRNLTILNKNGTFFKNMDQNIVQLVQTKGLFYFNVIRATLTDTIDGNSVLSNLFDYTATTTDAFNRKLAVTIQGKGVPLYGTLFSPQANIFQHRLGNKGAIQTLQSVRASQQLISGFFDLVRKQPYRMSQDQLYRRSFTNFQVTPGPSQGIYSWYVI